MVSALLCLDCLKMCINFSYCQNIACSYFCLQSAFFLLTHCMLVWLQKMCLIFVIVDEYNIQTFYRYFRPVKCTIRCFVYCSHIYIILLAFKDLYYVTCFLHCLLLKMCINFSYCQNIACSYFCLQSAFFLLIHCMLVWLQKMCLIFVIVVCFSCRVLFFLWVMFDASLWALFVIVVKKCSFFQPLETGPAFKGGETPPCPPPIVASYFTGAPPILGSSPSKSKRFASQLLASTA